MTQPAAPRRFSLVPRTLTARLVTGVVVLVIAIVTTTGAATYYQLHSFLFQRLDQQVNAQADSTANSVVHPDRYNSDPCNPVAAVCVIRTIRQFGPPPTTKQYIVLLSQTGDVRSTVVAGGSLLALQLSSGDRQRLVSSGPNVSTVTTTDGAQARVAVRPEDGYFVVFGVSTSEVNATLHRLLLLELAIGAAGVLLAVAISTAGLGLALQPLKRVTRTAQEVTAELSPTGAGLDRRVPDTDSTTEVGQLATSFNAMLETVEEEFAARRESEERMRQFLADASHELRTPLTSIRGYAELARMQRARRGPGQPDDSEDTIGRIESEGTRMSRLVEDLLVLARGDDDAEAPVPHAWFAADEVVEDVVSAVQVAHPQRVITIDVEPALSIFGDRDQLGRVVRNLVTNAAVHTDPAGAIAVTARRENDAVLIQVADQGPGLSPEEAAHVFERFWRADKARTRVRGGSGLGMSIVEQAVTAHEGQVYFDSDVERGSTVTVILPQPQVMDIAADDAVADAPTSFRA